ncbi:MAG: tetratricopeptide repeat protein [Bacteroidota bacterium]
MANNEYIDKIDEYLDGELNDQEKNAFEKELEKDATLEQELRANLLLREVIEHGYKEEMRTNIRKWRQESNESNQTGSTRIRPLFVRIAAAASVLLVAGMLVFNIILPQYSNSNIATAYYEPVGDLAGGSRSTTDGDVLDEAIAAFENGDYANAITGFQNFPNNDQALYGLAHTYYLTERYNEAAQTFDQLIDKANIEYIEQAQFYKVLSMLKAEQVNDEFNTLLDQIIAENGFYADEARNIKKKLKSFWRNF